MLKEGRKGVKGREKKVLEEGREGVKGRETKGGLRYEKGYVHNSPL